MKEEIDEMLDELKYSVDLDDPPKSEDLPQEETWVRYSVTKFLKR